MVIGSMIELKVLVLIIMWTVQNMKANGLKTNNQVMGLKLGQMVQSIVELIKVVRRKVEANLNGMMELLTMDNLPTTTLKVMVFMFGLTKEDSTDNGLTIRCMERESLLGQMEKNIAVFYLIDFFRWLY